MTLTVQARAPSPAARAAGGASMTTMTDRSFDAVTDLFHEISGIRLVETKKPLVAGRLQKLAAAAGHASIDRYVEALVRRREPGELVKVVDRLTTNETYFFREPEHFKLLEEMLKARPPGAGTLRVWSAASSTGEEAYSVAMVLADKLGPAGWEVVGTDLSTQVVESACRGLYTMERARHVPPAYLRRFCRKGQGPNDGLLLVARELRERVKFGCANLMQTLPEIGTFDLIFLRNVLIYFDVPGKQAIARRVAERLVPDGTLLLGHAETIDAAGAGLRLVRPSVYRRAA